MTASRKPSTFLMNCSIEDILDVIDYFARKEQDPTVESKKEETYRARKKDCELLKNLFAETYHIDIPSWGEWLSILENKASPMKLEPIVEKIRAGTLDIASRVVAKPAISVTKPVTVANATSFSLIDENASYAASLYENRAIKETKQTAVEASQKVKAELNNLLTNYQNGLFSVSEKDESKLSHEELAKKWQAEEFERAGFKPRR